MPLEFLTFRAGYLGIALVFLPGSVSALYCLFVRAAHALVDGFMILIEFLWTSVDSIFVVRCSA